MNDGTLLFVNFAVYSWLLLLPIVAVEARELKGLEIAARMRVVCEGDFWSVPSQTTGGKYRVCTTAPSCTCEDFELRKLPCKHVYAVRFVMGRERGVEPTLLAPESDATPQSHRPTYKQNWPAYNRAQRNEKHRFQTLLAELCRGVQEPLRAKTGRKPVPLSDSIFAAAFKVYSTFSSRRFDSDLREAHERGYLSKAVPSMKTTAFMEDESFTPILKQLVHESSLPLRAVETEFAIDSSGFGSCRFERWIDEKYGVPRKRAVWVKAHIACGVKTNVVTAVRVLDKDSADARQFAPLVKETATGFSIGEVSADKAYGSVENFEAVAGFGGNFYPSFKSNATGGVGGLFEKAFHYFSFKKTST